MRRAIRDFEATIGKALYVLALGAVAGQLELAYMGDYSRENISRVRRRITGQADRLGGVHEDGVDALIELAGCTKGPIWEEVGSRLGNENGVVNTTYASLGMQYGIYGAIVAGVVGAVTQVAGDAARESKRYRREGLEARASEGKGCVMTVVERCLADLDSLEFRYNDANALIWHGDKVSLAVIEDGALPIEEDLQEPVDAQDAG
ncbi:MAG: hypothetical protein IKG18_09285 [Atopobiaceae bacterium]|nr:hypothetical protein [Atopobiaceae bacterium]